MEDQKESAVIATSIGINIPVSEQFDNKKEEDVEVVSKDNSSCQPNLQSLTKDELFESLRNENKLLKGRLKGFEALTSIYKQSKLRCSELQKQCDEQKSLIEQYQVNGSLEPFSSIGRSHDEDDVECNDFSMNLETCLENAGKLFNGFEVLDAPVFNKNMALSHIEIPASLRNGSEEVSTCENEQFDTSKDAEELELNHSTNHHPSVVNIGNCDEEDNYAMEKKGCCLEENESSLESFEIEALREFQHHLTNASASLESRSFLQELLAVGMKVIRLEKQSSEEQKNVKKISLCQNASTCQTDLEVASNFATSSPKLILSPSKSTQTKPVASKSDRAVNRKLSLQDACMSTELSSSDDVCHFSDEKQLILQAQLMTFKDDFEQERRDREKIRSKYDSLKKHFDRVSAELVNLKKRSRASEAQYEAVRKENTLLRQQITAVKEKLKNFQPSSNLLLHQHQHQHQSRHRRTEPLYAGQKWLCSRCTFLNQHQQKACIMCGLRQHLSSE